MTFSLPPRVIRLSGMTEKFKVSRATIWRWVNSIDDFPKPFALGPNTTGWDEHEVDTYLASRKGGKK